MPFVPLVPPQPLAIDGPVAAITIDAARRRVFVAGAHSVVMLDADTGKVRATITIGGVRSIALEPLGGHVFAGTSDGHIDDLDPDRKSIARELDAGASVDVMLYDAQSGMLYASSAGTHGIAVFDSRSFARATTIALPGPAAAQQMAHDPITHELYVAAANAPGITVIDTASNAVRTSFPTPGVAGSRTVHFDDVLGQLVITGANGVLDIYDRAGLRRAHAAVPAGVSACDVDTATHAFACTAPAGITFVQLTPRAVPVALGTLPFAAPAVAAADPMSHQFLAVRSRVDGSEATFERFRATDPVASPSPASH
jgi:hypothetical protein